MKQRDAARLRETQAALAASQQDLTRVEAVCTLAKRRAADLEETLSRAGSRASDAIAVIAQQARDLLVAWQQRDLAQAELASVDEAAGRDIAKPDELLVDRVADLLRGRTEATQRAIELAAELASAHQELERHRGPTGSRDEAAPG